MRIRRILVLAGAIAALCLVVVSTALAAGTSVSVRVEGLKRTVLPATVVHTHSGSITKGGTPAGTCSATTAAGALDVATHGDWQGKVYPGTPGIFITSIFGLKPTGSNYWTVFVDNKTANFGVCDLRLHRGDQLLFAVTSGSQFPIVLRGPSHAKSGQPFKLTAFYYKPELIKGHTRFVTKPLAGAHVGHLLTNGLGAVTLVAHRAGKLKLTASRTGYIRSATSTVTVKA